MNIRKEEYQRQCVKENLSKLALIDLQNKNQKRTIRKRDLQKRPTKETCKRDLQKRPTKKRDLQKRPTKQTEI